MKLQELAQHAQRALLIGGVKAATKVLKTQSGISLPEDFETLPEAEQRKRINEALLIALEPSGLSYDKVYSSLDELYKDAEADRHQVTGLEILRRTIKTTDEIREQVIEAIAERAGGRTKTKNRVYSVLRYGQPKHFALERFFLEKYGDSPAQFKYCSGQDMSWEMKDLRNTLNK